MPTPKIYQVANLQTQLTSTSDSANNRVLKAGDTMTGNLNVANVVSGTALTLSTGASSNGNIIFSANGVEDMRITPAGDVGIGTTNPGYRLDVQNPAATTWARIGNSAINSGAGIIFNGASTQKNWIIASQYNVNGGLEFTQTTTGGGSTISSTPTLQLNPNGTISSYAASGTGAQFSVFSNGQTTVPVTLAQGFATATDNIGYLYNRANADFVFGTNNTERARFNSTGAFVFAGGATNASGIGIAFPATQSASSDANTLDDYEEGTWSPNVGGNATYSRQLGFYTKIGRCVVAMFDIQINTIGTGSTSLIGGLPFTSAPSGSPQGIVAPVSYWASLTTAVNWMALRIDESTTNMLNQYTTGTATTALVNGGLYQSGTRIIGTITYFV